MKHLLIALVLFMSTNSFAAQWEKVDMNKSSFAWLEGIKLFTNVYELVDVKESEEFIDSLKQLTYIIRAEWGNYSIHEAVDIYPGSDEFKVLTEDATRAEPELLREHTLAALIEFYYMTDRLYDIEIYEGNDGNTFGECGNVYLFEKKSKQVGVFSLCYAE